MNKYQLTIKMKDGSIKYDFTQATNKSIEEVKKQYEALINNALHSWANVESVLVEL